MRGRSLVGCSGWVYRDWRGVVYPEGLPQRRWFEHYASTFDTVEINNTFYRLPPPETVERWERQAPPGFVYAVKLGGFGSHRMKLRDAASWLPNHFDRIDRLADHLGPNLVQLPPRWKRDVGRLDEFLAEAGALRAADRGDTASLRWAVELRDESWVDDAVFAVLERHGAALCIHDLLPRLPWVRTAGWTYVRFHGPNAVEQPYNGLYGGRRLAPVAKRLDAWLDDGCDVYAYFNNDWYGHAATDAAWLRDRLAGRRADHKTA